MQYGSSTNSLFDCWVKEGGHENPFHFLFLYQLWLTLKKLTPLNFLYSPPLGEAEAARSHAKLALSDNRYRRGNQNLYLCTYGMGEIKQAFFVSIVVHVLVVYH